MDAAFWHQKWQSNQIGFHRNDVNPFLVEFFDALALSPGQRIFLPLCGKTLDIGWLLSNSYQVVGVEIYQPAIEALFEQLGFTPHITKLDKLIKYSCQQLTVFVGDIFDLTANELGDVNAVYDRAAIVALPETMRNNYAKQVNLLTKNAPQLIINYEYDQSLMAGPPFSVPNNELLAHFQDNYVMKQLYHGAVEGGMRGTIPACENVWLLAAKK